MPMSKDTDFGTISDGSRNEEYCSYCFKKGKFTQPDITMKEMLKIGMKGIDESPDMGKFMKFIVKKSYPMQIKKLKRWQ
jgi:methyl coenzyme M reductase subunit D